MIFTIADTHFNHAKMVVDKHRPFESVGQMNRHMIDAWNRTVTPVDEVYILGDFAFRPNRFCVCAEMIDYTPIPMIYFNQFKQKGAERHGDE